MEPIEEVPFIRQGESELERVVYSRLVHSAIEALRMRNINPRFTLHCITLQYITSCFGITDSLYTDS